ncbi:carbohydrate kinase [Schaalia sp. ZJ405]|uniref:xylulokinase n=1 Tax=unclassified Schaalia TaxID=2691889 RepID=UPI0013EC6641|nr:MULTISPECIES: FGGY family carbohydrate kinase [unclassified Schaalia]QPK81948.1 carbohydrate kinase [Schaalia sp. ZJ405]
MADYLIGIDAGTTGCKTIVFDLDGHILGQDYREYPCVYPGPGLVEQTYDDIIPPLIDSCRAAVEASGVPAEEIRALSFSSQAPLLAMVDHNGELVRPFVSWQDLRGAPYIPRLRESYGAEKFYRESGDPLGTNSAAPKWVWLKEHEPQNWARTAWFLSEQEFLMKEWGAREYWTDLSSASREGMLDVDTMQWSEAIHDLVGIPISRRAQVVAQPGTPIGTISADIARKTGLSEKTLLCLGAHDQNCSTFGGGAVRGGDCVMVMGTFGSCYVVMDEPLRDPQRKLVVKPNHGMGNWTIEAFSNTSASSFRWYRDTFCEAEQIAGRVADLDPYDIITTQAQKAPIGAHGVTFLPYLGGASGARQNPDARANFSGMTLATKKTDIARAVLEGVSFEMRDILNAQAAAGIEIGTIRLVGGAAKSAFWSQMLADIFQRPIEILRTSEAGCLGAAMYAGVGAGLYESCQAAADRAVAVVGRFEPNPDNAQAYDEAFERFVNTYEGLASTVF